MWKHVNSKHILHANDKVMRHARFGYDMHGHDDEDDDDDDDELYRFVFEVINGGQRCGERAKCTYTSCAQNALWIICGVVEQRMTPNYVTCKLIFHYSGPCDDDMASLEKKTLNTKGST